MSSYIEQNTAYFSKNAKNYDLATAIIAPLRTRLFNAASAKPDDRVLDVATGTGAVALRFARQGCSVTGVDLSAHMLAVAEAKRKDLPVTFMEGDASTLPFAEYSFDIATVSFALHDMPLEVRTKALKEVNRVLKPGGRFVIMDYNKPANVLWCTIAMGIVNSYEELHFKQFIEADLIAMLKNSGFSVACHEKLLGGAVQLLVCPKA
jgi:demethylmenaquinone methyltransferase/2-methoxy-6-polyprenyl-1,4-benzoquinol methylase